MITAWDPGDTTGWACWDENGVMLDMGQCSYEDIPKTFKELEKYGVHKTVIVEDYVLFSKRAQSQVGSRMKAPKGIGSLEALAYTVGATLIKQDASIKSTALKWSQIKMPSRHSSTHKYDAFLHGYYWLVKEGLVKTALELEMEKKRG